MYFMHNLGCVGSSRFSYGFLKACPDLWWWHYWTSTDLYFPTEREERERLEQEQREEEEREYQERLRKLEEQERKQRARQQEIEERERRREEERRGQTEDKPKVQNIFWNLVGTFYWFTI